ncbi:expressed unknown protein [Seminavis robusta]|uniref:Uncharacterized protein n=1 Tax=Seminavis robusta TaxID=568900 RepID=A0A9N8HQS2_9STRA|nr:expressed unknown protein [Seminavis robusta]|eukprot:Sro1011_g231100.1 n/a (602) ;mRNA; f:30028-31833
MDVSSERDARNRLCRLLNTLVVLDNNSNNHKSNHKSTKITSQIAELVLEYPRLTLEYVRHHRSGDELTILGFYLQSSTVADSTIEEFCRVFPKLLTIECNQDQPGRLPLHAICGLGMQRRSLIPVVCSLSPQATSKRDQFNNLPIHIYFLNHRHEQLETQNRQQDVVVEEDDNEDDPQPQQQQQDPSVRAELSALIEAYPEGVFCGSQMGLQPIQYILSDNNLLLTHQEQQQRTIFTDTFHSLSNVQITSQLFLPYVAAESLGIPQANLLTQFLQRVQRLNFRPIGWPFTPEGWVQFMASLSTYTELEQLEITIPYYLLENHEECYQVVVETLPQLLTLESLILCFPTNVPPLRRAVRNDNDDDTTTTHVADMAVPIAALLQQQHNNNHNHNLQELIVRDGIDMDPTLILQAVANNNNHNNNNNNHSHHLKILDIRSVRNNFNVAQPLAHLLQHSRLESLAMRYITMEPRRVVFQALAGNTHLKSIRLPGLVESTTSAAQQEEDHFSRLSLVLQHYNATLQEVQCLGASFQDVSGKEHAQVQQYALLNRHGRVHVRRESCSCHDVLKLVQHVRVADSQKQLSIVYGLLREAPVHWCCLSSN